MTVWHPRSDWTGAGRGGASLGSGGQLEGTAVHWPGTTTNRFGKESAAKVAARLRAWRDYHVRGRGWSDIGYNLAVDQTGGAWDLRGITRVGAHCASRANPDANWEWIGVLFILGDEEEPSDEMVAAFRWLRTNVILKRYPHATKITGHGRAPGVPGAQTSCPGPYVAADITSGTLTRPGGGGGTPEEDDMPSVEQIIDGLAEALQPRTGNTKLRQAVALLMQDVVFADPDVQTHIRNSVMNTPIQNRVDEKNYPLGTAVSSAWYYAWMVAVIAKNGGVVPDRLKDQVSRIEAGPILPTVTAEEIPDPSEEK